MAAADFNSSKLGLTFLQTKSSALHTLATNPWNFRADDGHALLQVFDGSSYSTMMRMHAEIAVE